MQPCYDVADGLMQCFESSDNSSVRKSSMLCLVALHDKVGKDLLPLLSSLNPSKVLRLLSEYDLRLFLSAVDADSCVQHEYAFSF